VTLYLADTSAWNRSARVARRWARWLGDGQIATCAPVKLELLFSARDSRDYLDLSFELGRLPYLEVNEAVSTTALRTQAALAVRGHHRIPAIDCLVAAIAELNGAVLLHYDRHFDAIARASSQETRWLARRGSLD
jgi:predicted nucleic acid-binding protein